MMRRVVIAVAIFTCISMSPALAQQSQQSYPRFTINAGIGPGFNQSRTSDFANTSFQVVGGGGYNFSHSVGTSIEYQYYNLSIKDSVAQQASLADPSGHLGSLTLNGIFRIPNHLGIYGIGGGGWYRRTVHSGKATVIPAGTGCQAIWAWWDVSCSNGVTQSAAVLGDDTDDAWGVNVGAGVNFRIRGRLKGYTELRYHHAYNSQISTQVTPLTFGIRW
jgi:opacity protein-like surface antigen